MKVNTSFVCCPVDVLLKLLLVLPDFVFELEQLDLMHKLV